MVLVSCRRDGSSYDKSEGVSNIHTAGQKSVPAHGACSVCVDAFFGGKSRRGLGLKVKGGILD
jgi:hypothetical protein